MPQAPTHCTYWARVPASAVPYIPRTLLGDNQRTVVITPGPEGALLRFTHEEGGDPADEARLFCAEHFSEVLLIRVKMRVS